MRPLAARRTAVLRSQRKSQRNWPPCTRQRPVHLYGQAADMSALGALAMRHRLAIVEDCAQAHLATAAGQPVGTIGVAGAFSVYPTKNQGALGDGGAVVTNDAALAARIRRLRNGGQADRYQHLDSGVSRLDEMQAAILRRRLERLAARTARRRSLAALYRTRLADAPVHVAPEIGPGHVYHLFTVRTADRAHVQAHLTSQGIGMLVHYPRTVPRQPAFADLPPAECPAADAIASQIRSLPLHPDLTEHDVDAIAAALHTLDARAMAAPTL